MNQLVNPVARQQWKNLTKITLQTRQFSSASTLRLQVTSINQYPTSKDEIKTLKAKLTKEKKVLSDLQKRLKKKEAQNAKKEKERKLKHQQQEKAKTAKQLEKLKLQRAKQKEIESEKVLIKKATQNFRKITALNAFVKETVTKDVPLKSAMETWNQLSADEKQKFQDKADVINEKRDEIFKPKPRRPASSYAEFLKLNYPPVPLDFTSASKEVNSKWKTLPESEKAKYGASAEERAEYKKVLKAWTDERVKAYKEYFGA